MNNFITRVLFFFSALLKSFTIDSLIDAINTSLPVILKKLQTVFQFYLESLAI